MLLGLRSERARDNALVDVADVVDVAGAIDTIDAIEANFNGVTVMADGFNNESAGFPLFILGTSVGRCSRQS